MRARSVSGVLVAVLAVGIGAGERLSGVVGDLPAVLGPVYDAAAGSDVRALGIALQSYAMVEGDLTGVTAADLVGWGWTASSTTAVRVWVDGDRFLVHARDVRRGASTLQISSDALAVRALPADRAWPDAADGDLPVTFSVQAARLPAG